MKETIRVYGSLNTKGKDCDSKHNCSYAAALRPHPVSVFLSGRKSAGVTNDINDGSSPWCLGKRHKYASMHSARSPGRGLDLNERQQLSLATPVLNK